MEKTFLCEFCKIQKNSKRFPLECVHKYCKKCISFQWETQIIQKKSLLVRCILSSCETIPSKKVIKSVLNEDIYDKYKELKAKKTNETIEKKNLVESEIKVKKKVKRKWRVGIKKRKNLK